MVKGRVRWYDRVSMSGMVRCDKTKISYSIGPRLQDSKCVPFNIDKGDKVVFDLAVDSHYIMVKNIKKV